MLDSEESSMSSKIFEVSRRYPLYVDYVPTATECAEATSGVVTAHQKVASAQMLPILISGSRVTIRAACLFEIDPGLFRLEAGLFESQWAGVQSQ